MNSTARQNELYREYILAGKHLEVLRQMNDRKPAPARPPEPTKKNRSESQ